MNWNVAAYLRLSKEDKDNMESNSISNQKVLIDKYINNKHDLELVDYYIDDGYSGTNFNRPAFEKLLQDITNGKINTIIVKDLSRLGRNHIEVDNYLENIFPMMNVRFISIIENIDSYENPESLDNYIVSIKNLINDAYAKDISKKVKSVLKTKKINGEFKGEDKLLEKDFKQIISNIKEDIIKTQIKTMQEVNSNLIMLYFRLGKIVSENKAYGNNFAKQVSTELKLTFPNMKGFSERNIRSMRLFYEEYADDEKWQQLVAKLPWGHNLLLIEKIKDKEIRKIYAENTIKNGWSRNVLSVQIETEFHKRIGNSNNNFNLSLPPKDSDLVNNTIKDPYIFDFITLKEEYKEQELENAMINKIKNLLVELGKGFSFVGNQYKISMEDKDYYIDLLFYHLELRCFVVVELKATSFKPEFIGQLGFYVTAIDETLKKEMDNPTIGLLLCKEKDRLSVEWSLKGTNLPIGVSSYKLNEYIPKDILDKLPTEDEINLYLDIEGDEDDE